MDDHDRLRDIPLLCDEISSSDVDSSDNCKVPSTPAKNMSEEISLYFRTSNCIQHESPIETESHKTSETSQRENSGFVIPTAPVKFEGKEPAFPKNDDRSENKSDNEEGEVEEGESIEVVATKRKRTQEEMSLREFDVLDEVGPYDEDDEDEDDNYADDTLSEEEIDAMLEEGLVCQQARKKLKTEQSSQNFKGKEEELGDEDDKKEENANDKEYTEKEKVVMVEKAKDHFEVLPDGWVTLTHNSGMPLYLHRASRVCTLSKPYFLGPGSARKHDIPLSAIPCLEYRRAKEEELKRKDEAGKSTLIVNGTEIPNARVETAQENEKSRQLTPLQLREYCEKLFEFETIRVVRFRSWVARRKFTKQKNEKYHQRPTLPKDTKLITCPIRQSSSDGKAGRAKEWIMNPNGKSYVCILHEYVQRALKDQPVYTFKELENTATPYLATISIGNIQYGTGFGSSKKLAKHDAAKSTLEILIPEMKDKIDQDKRLWGRAGNSKEQTDLSFFDGIKIEDPRVTEFCVKTTEPLPHAILLTCLQRNFGLSEMNIKYETVPLKHSKNEFTMTVGNHTAKVICQNKRDGKQKAAQAILQALHPHVPSWGSLLRLYGNTSVKTMKEKKIEEQEITLLQSRGTSHSPNYAILNKLREEMKKFKAMRSAIRPIGKFIPPDDVDLPLESGSDLSNVVI